MVVIERVDAARVALAADLEDGPDHLERLVEAGVAEHRQDDAELLRAEHVVAADLGLLDDEERPVWRDLEAGALGDGLGGDGDRVRRPVPLVVPQERPQPLRLVGARSTWPPSATSCVAQRLVDASSSTSRLPSAEQPEP